MKDLAKTCFVVLIGVGILLILVFSGKIPDSDKNFFALIALTVIIGFAGTIAAILSLHNKKL